MNRQYKEIEFQYRKSLEQILNENPEYLRNKDTKCDTNQKKPEREYK